MRFFCDKSIDRKSISTPYWRRQQNLHSQKFRDLTTLETYVCVYVYGLDTNAMTANNLLGTDTQRLSAVDSVVVTSSDDGKVQSLFFEITWLAISVDDVMPSRYFSYSTLSQKVMLGRPNFGLLFIMIFLKIHFFLFFGMLFRIFNDSSPDRASDEKYMP